MRRGAILSAHPAVDWGSRTRASCSSSLAHYGGSIMGDLASRISSGHATATGRRGGKQVVQET
jgi:hypothetical protein